MGKEYKWFTENLRRGEVRAVLSCQGALAIGLPEPRHFPIGFQVEVAWMAEEGKEKEPAPVTPVPKTEAPVKAQTATSTPAQPAPKAVQVQKTAQTAIPPPKPAQPAQPRPTEKSSRRSFIKAMLAVGAVLSIVPFVPWGQFLSSSVTSTGKPQRQQVFTDINAFNGAASGLAVDVSDLTMYPPNKSWLITYPSSGNLTQDSQNPDTFVKWRLIRLPEQLGGSAQDATAFVAFSEVCVHLWCSPNYDPEDSTNATDETYQCPCHGSVYRIPDALSIAGPASTQPPPNNAVPMLSLTSDPDGSLNIEPAVFDVNHNGVVGYGRYYETYETYILPIAKGESTTSTTTASGTS